MSSIDPGSDNGLVNIESISPDAANKMVAAALAKAGYLNLKKGKVAVCGREGFELASGSCGGVTRGNDIVVAAKLATVMNTTRSTHEQAAYMANPDEPIDWLDYAGAVRTKFGGGMKVYADAERTRWVGAIAFSGGSENQDMTCCDEGAGAVGFYVDPF